MMHMQMTQKINNKTEMKKNAFKTASFATFSIVFVFFFAKKRVGESSTCDERMRF